MFNIIDIENWERKEHYYHYSNVNQCTYSITLKLEVSNIVNSSFKFYPTIIYLISKTVNDIKEFKMSFEDSKLGYYDVVNPSYTIFNNNSKTFSSIYTEYNDDFNLFYNNCIEDIKTYSKSTSFSPKACNIKNLFNISSIPWVSFDGFNLNINNCFDYLPPIFTIGKYFNDSNKILMPIAIQVNHRVCDGYHVGLFAESLQENIFNLKK